MPQHSARDLNLPMSGHLHPDEPSRALASARGFTLALVKGRHTHEILLFGSEQCQLQAFDQRHVEVILAVGGEGMAGGLDPFSQGLAAVRWAKRAALAPLDFGLSGTASKLSRGTNASPRSKMYSVMDWAGAWIAASKPLQTPECLSRRSRPVSSAPTRGRKRSTNSAMRSGRGSCTWSCGRSRTTAGPRSMAQAAADHAAAWFH